MRPVLPDFRTPPLCEVALSVQFDPVERLRSVQLGKLWDRFQDRFPIVEEHPPLDPAFERFGKRSPQADFQMEIRPLPAVPIPRLWFLNPPGTELIQVQQDRFAHNWRKTGDGDAYPRYERVRDTFLEQLQRLEEFVTQEQLGHLRPNQCEVTYVNQLGPLDDADIHARPDRVLAWLNPLSWGSDDVETEDLQLTVRSKLLDNDDPIGRLHVTVNPVFRRADGAPLLIMSLTARFSVSDVGAPLASRLDRGRIAIVNAFARLTTPEMHLLWERTDA